MFFSAKQNHHVDDYLRPFISEIKECNIKGIYRDHRVCYPGCENDKRTDLDYTNKIHREHHVRPCSFWDTIKVGAVSQFPIDYMHCVLLGVVKHLIKCWTVIRKKNFSMKRNAIEKVNERLSQLRECMPREFARKQRTWKDIEFWKATEFRMFLCYSGPVALKSILATEYYNHFLLLSCAIRILCSPTDYAKNVDYAEQMLKDFVGTFANLYGEENVVYNVHSLLHLAEDSKSYGILDSFSAFKFENYNQILKKMIKKSS